MKHADPIRGAAVVALAVSLLLLGVKFTAYFLTGSKAVLSDAVESIINVVTGAFVLVTVTISRQPADESHPYGHGKVEAFSAGLEGGLIVLAAVMILVEAVPGFFAPAAPANLGVGMVMLAGAGVVNLTVGLYLLQTGKKHKSDALAADGRHLLTDFQTSAGVLAGLFLVRLSGWLWLDPLIACLVAVNILVPGLRLVRNAVRSLMDEADPVLLARIVEALNEIKQPGWLYPHKLRVIRSGRYHHVDLHIAMPHYWPLDRVHAVEEQINEALLAELGEEGDVMIHIDPCEPEYCPACSHAPCDSRSRDFNGTAEWELPAVTASRSEPPGGGREVKEQ